MSTSIMYHAFGLREHEYLGTEYNKNTVIFHVKTKKEKLSCSNCGCRDVICKGAQQRSFRAPPCGTKQVMIRAAIQRLECKRCERIMQENLGFADPKKSYTKTFANYVIDLCRLMTISDVMHFTQVGWDTIKRIEKTYLEKHYSKPRLKEVRKIAIDEFAVLKGHKYMTVVMDLDSGRVLFVGDGHSAKTLDPFWKSLRCSGAKIEAVATDMWPAYIEAIERNLPEAQLVFDRFHITKKMNDTLSKLRRSVFREEEELNNRKLLKGTRWLLLKKDENLNQERSEKERLELALSINKPLAISYYLKEDLQQLWRQKTLDNAKDFLGKWVAKAFASGVHLLKKFAKSLLKHRSGIFAWYHHKISTGPLEGMNNKIKVLKRKAYGYRDMEFFKLKIKAAHKTKYALCG